MNFVKLDVDGVVNPDFFFFFFAWLRSLNFARIFTLPLIMQERAPSHRNRISYDQAIQTLRSMFEKIDVDVIKVGQRFSLFAIFEFPKQNWCQKSLSLKIFCLLDCIASKQGEHGSNRKRFVRDDSKKSINRIKAKHRKRGSSPKTTTTTTTATTKTKSNFQRQEF